MKYLLLVCVILLSGCSDDWFRNRGLEEVDGANEGEIIIYCRNPHLRIMQVEKVNEVTVKLSCVFKGDKNGDPR